MMRQLASVVNTVSRVFRAAGGAEEIGCKPLRRIGPKGAGGALYRVELFRLIRPVRI